MSRRRSLVMVAPVAVVVMATAAAAALRPSAPRDEPVEVDGYRALAPHRLELGYSPVTASCGGEPLHVPEVTETASTVSLRLTQTVTSDDGPCVAVGEIGRVEVALSAPLGERRVVDASTGRPVGQGLAWTPSDRTGRDETR